MSNRNPRRSFRDVRPHSLQIGLVSVTALAISMGVGPASAGPGAAAAKAAQVRAGKALYGKNCKSCHGVDAKGGAGPKLKGTPMSDARITKTVNKGKPGQMPAFGGKLKPVQVKSIIAYLRSLS